MKIHTQPTMLVDRGQGLRFTESPRWHDGKFWFLDIHGNAIRTVTLDGVLKTELELAFKPNGLGIRHDGSLVFADALARKVYRWNRGALTVLADLSEKTVFCLSDGVMDSLERLYIGDIGYNFFDPANQPVHTCVIACVHSDGSTQVVARDLSFPNGMAVSPDGRTLVVAECMGEKLSAFDILPGGALHNRRIYARLSGGVHPDGIALDAEGAVWLANPEGEFGALRVREGGEIVECIAVEGSHVYAVSLGGPQRRHLLLCCSDTHNPMEIASSPSATLRVVEVDVPGAGRP